MFKIVKTQLVVLILMISILCCKSNQKKDEEKVSFRFISYNDVIKELNANGRCSRFYLDIDYEAMLYLDTNCMSTFKKINPNFLKENYIDSILKNYTLSSDENSNLVIASNIRKISDLFVDKKTFDEIISKTGQMINYDYIGHTIYQKENTKAIFTESIGSTITTYRVTLINHKLKLEDLIIIIE